VHRVRVDMSSLRTCEDLVLLEPALGALAGDGGGAAVLLEAVGSAPVLRPDGMKPAERGRLIGWGESLSQAAGSPGPLRVGWTNGEVRGPVLELLLACDLLLVAESSRFWVFPPAEGYVPVAGSLGRLVDRMGTARLLRACMGGVSLSGADAVQSGVAGGLAAADDLSASVARIVGGAPPALGGIAELSRRGVGLGTAEAEALERAVFSWCFAVGEHRERIRSFRNEAHPIAKGNPEDEVS
jgi:enoyl-CoA hydratase/carnithine racemase